MPLSLHASLPHFTSPRLLLPPPEPLLKRSAWREPLFYLLPTCHSAAILSACFRCNPIQNAAVACFTKDFLFTWLCMCVCVCAQHSSEPVLR
ncbi:hypothetical protein CLIM01_12313 [Colletotrichum limetticola]|uniref:Uncharacterized protein n=1 Tax=Colletotrichum limetticola TaxID=1209924 RepID=A0ABQ9PGP6_9PEZI|nr:hypothetical protein CLIM01_12313 [Colletotrichum limetticola]